MASKLVDPNTIINSAPFDATYLELYIDSSKLDDFVKKNRKPDDVVEIISAILNQANNIYVELSLTPTDPKSREQIGARYARWISVATKIAYHYQFSLAQIEQCPLYLQKHLLVGLANRAEARYFCIFLIIVITRHCIVFGYSSIL